MLVTLNEILKIAEEKKIAVGSFNCTCFEAMNAVIDAAEEVGVPVILAHATVHEKVSHIDRMGPIMLYLAKNASVPVCVHLDHCQSLEYMEKALKIGFTGVMYDGSELPYEENVKNTTEAVKLARKYGAGIEAELGALATDETGKATASGPVYTKPEEAMDFIKRTGIDALAPSFGTAHGIYKSKPVLDLELVKTIHVQSGLPLVMHGGSGVSPEDYRIGIQNGLRKINYFSYMSKAGITSAKATVEKGEIKFFHDITFAAQNAMKEDVKTAMKMFANME